MYNRRLHLKVLAPIEQLEKVPDDLQDSFADEEDFSAIVLPVQALLP